jgi:hypothetical protein
MTILRDESSNGRYLGFMFLILTFPMSALGFIMLPKVSAYYEASIRARNSNPRQTVKRGDARGSVHISGLYGNPYAIDNNTRVAAGVGSEALNTVTGTPQVSGLVAESPSGAEAPLTEAIDCPSPPQPEH